jgi:predicted nucleic acid-binding protein
MTAGTPRVILDASVLYSRVLHELFGRLALENQLFEIAWSDELLAETKQALIERKPVSEPIAERWVSYLRAAFPEGRVDIAATGRDVNLTELTDDPDDEHVCALAIAAAPSILITFDHGFHAEALAHHQVTVTHPDDYLAPLCDEQLDPLLAIIEHQAAAWHSRPVPQLIDALERAGAPRLANRLRAQVAPN